MAFLDNPLNFSFWQEPEKEDLRADSPTVLVENHGPGPTVVALATTKLLATYKLCNPEYAYSASQNPIRALTKPSVPLHNEGCDNEHYNLIVCVKDTLISPEAQEYTVLDNLGEGTFGQVFKCRRRAGDFCAAKVIKNKPAYFIQGLIEVKILSKLNRTLDPDDSSNIVRMLDYFVYKNHLVIIFELLSLNLYELIRKNSLKGFSLKLIKSFTKQILDALCVLEAGSIVHCDMKPENVLLVNDSVGLKVIDFGSACFEDATVYTYIQSRYYRSPEVLLGVPYGSEIDSWSLGCICAELYIGIPLFPGANEYEQLSRIVDMLGALPQHMVRAGKFKDKYYVLDNNNYRLTTRQEYQQRVSITLPQFREYTNLASLDDLSVLDRETHNVEDSPELLPLFIDFLKGLLKLDPRERWSARQAVTHPFVTAATEFNPPPKLAKTKAVPSGALRGSCPSLLERIRGSQDTTSNNKEVSYRPTIEELTDDFFKGFAHGKLSQLAQNPPVVRPPESSKKAVPPNPYCEMSFQPIMPPPNITGPRYARPHSHDIPRPESPSVEDQQKKNSQKKKKYSSERKCMSSSSQDHKPKLGHTKTQSQEENKRAKSHLYGRLPVNSFAGNLPSFPAGGAKVATPLPLNFLEKIKKEAKLERTE